MVAENRMRQEDFSSQHHTPVLQIRILSAIQFLYSNREGRRRLSINPSKGGRWGDIAQLQPLKSIEERALVLVGRESRAITTRGLAESSHASRDPDTLVLVQSDDDELDEPIPEMYVEELEQELDREGEEELELQYEEVVDVGEGDPAVISIESDEASGPSVVQLVTPRSDISHTPTPQTSGQQGEQSPTSDRQTECLISLCRETVTIGRDLIQGIDGFSTNWSQFSTTWSQFNTNFTNWSSVQTEIVRETLEMICEQTAATNALRHALLAGHSAAPKVSCQPAAGPLALK
uniref:uncharacterized protein n=1 Tax=Pristiophorus japonicus TaxID=55135 RepID=UPI00398EA965